MPSAGIVPGFDEVEHGHARLGLIPESFPLDEFSLERREKALTHRVGSVGQVSVRQGLIELEFGDRLRIRGIECGGLIEPEVSLGWGAGGTQQRRPAGKIEVG